MAKNCLLIILYLIFSLLTTTSIGDLSLRDLESAIFALRANGYNLFGNSIAVSDLSVQILSHSFNSTINGGSFGRHGFTFLAPPNSALFSLDMNTDAFTYVHSLRFHVIPRRLSFSELRNVSMLSNPYVETLVRGHHLFVASSGRRGVAIDGVRISFPDLYLRPDIAVHGLEGILVVSNEEYFHRHESFAVSPATLTPSPTPSHGGDDFTSFSVASPSIDAHSPEIGGFPAFSPEVEQFSAYSPEIGGFQPFPSDEEFPQFIDEIPPPPDTSSPEFPPNRSPIGAFSSEYDVIPSSHDLAFTGGTYSAISVPPIDGYSLENDLILAPSSSEDFRSPNEYSSSAFLSPSELSSSPMYGAEVSPTVFLSPSEFSSSPVYHDQKEEKEVPAVVSSPNRWSTQVWNAHSKPPSEFSSSQVYRDEKEEKKLPAVVSSPNRWSTTVWSAHSQTPPPVTAGDRAVKRGDVNQEKQHHGAEYTEPGERESLGQGNAYDWRNWEF